MSNPDYNLKAEVSETVHTNLTQFKAAISNNIAEEIEIHRLCCNLIMKSWLASWLPFGWMHSLAASYYTRKARRIYNAKKVAEELMKLNGSKRQ